MWNNHKKKKKLNTSQNMCHKENVGGKKKELSIACETWVEMVCSEDFDCVGQMCYMVA